MCVLQTNKNGCDYKDIHIYTGITNGEYACNRSYENVHWKKGKKKTEWRKGTTIEQKEEEEKGEEENFTWVLE